MLVNNAGVAVAGPMHGSDVDRLEAMVNINITAALRLAHAAVAGFVARGRGTLINVSSVLALAPERFNAVYSGTKSFMLNLSMALQTELANTGIRVQAVLPGATRTEIWGKAGVDIAAMPADRLMDAGEMVDAALAGLDMGEAVTIPSLPDIAEWSRFNDARLAMGPNLSLAHPAGDTRSGRSGVSAATRPGQVLAIVCAGIVLANLDLFIVNVALPDIAQDSMTRIWGICPGF